MKLLKNNSSTIIPVLGFATTLAALYFGGKFLNSKFQDNRQQSESNDLDSNDPKIKYAAQLAARCYSAMDGDGTDSDELNRVAVAIYKQGSGFFKLVSDSYKKLTKGSNLYNDIHKESSPPEFARFLRCLNTGVFEPDSWFDGLGYIALI